jgi:hypothetical protein
LEHLSNFTSFLFLKTLQNGLFQLPGSIDGPLFDDGFGYGLGPSQLAIPLND